MSCIEHWQCYATMSHLQPSIQAATGNHTLSPNLLHKNCFIVTKYRQRQKVTADLLTSLNRQIPYLFNYNAHSCITRTLKF